MRRHAIVLALLLGAGLAGPPARAGDATGAYAPYEDLLEDGPDVDATLAALRKKLDAWGRLVERWTGTPYETPALVEEERLERAAASVVVRNRTILREGNLTAERALRFLIQKHADSRNLPDHILRLGDLYAEVARDYVEQHERPLAFEEDEFVQRADRALEMYRKVA